MASSKVAIPRYIISRVPRKCRLLIWLFCLLLVPYLYIQLTFPVHYVFKHSNINGACIIPRLNPFDPSILKFVWDPEPLVCDSTPSILYSNTSGYVNFNQSALKHLKLSESSIHCQYRTLKRSNDDRTVTFTDYADFTPPLPMESDFIHVICRGTKEGLLFDKLISGISVTSVKRKMDVKEESPEQLSVLMFGLDSVSRSAAVRKMPKTFQYLTKDLNSYDLKGYMKVGENTLPNVVALLTGLRVWSKEVPIKNYLTERFDDKLPFLWKNFSSQGYATLYAEDMPDFGTFTYYAGGFDEQPTDHYFRPFWLGLNELEKIKSKLSPVFLYLENKKVNVQKSSSLCYKDKSRHSVQIEYLKSFVSAYKRKRKFLFSFLSELSHEYPNLLANGDDDFLEFLKWLKEEGHLDNAVLIFFSDHGARIDEIRNTFIGRIEVRMPLMEIYIPKHIKSKYPAINESLTTNTERLSVPFDIHRTVMDLFAQNFENPSKSYIEGRVRGHSLLQPLPPERSCRDAWVPENYCACYTSSPVNVSNSGISDMLGKQLVMDINKQLSSQPRCVQLSLHKVQDMQEVSHGLKHSGTENTGISFFQFFAPETPKKRYDISVVTVPGHGIFEATYVVGSNSEAKLFGNIVRVNRYGDQPCISDKLLRPLCYCNK